MKILGLNGWNDGTHDPAAALVVDGRLVSFIEEERLSRRKHAISDFPHLSVQAVLTSVGMRLEDIDVVAYGYDLPRYSFLHGQRWSLTDADFLRTVIGAPLERTPKLVWVRHHDAHAASAFYPSGFDAATVLVVDGIGEEYSTSLYRGYQTRLEPIRCWRAFCSLGILYEAASTYCGFNFLDGGKTMGLAAYGVKQQQCLPLRWNSGDLCSPIDDTLLDRAVFEAWHEILERQFGQPTAPPLIFDPLISRVRLVEHSTQQHHPNVAAAAQEMVETMMVSLVDYGQAETGFSDVCLSGGVALNCVSNGILIDRCHRMFIQPASHDAGVAAGAAMKVAADSGEQIEPMTGVDLGPSYSSLLVEKYLDTCHLPARRVDDPAEEAVRRLLRGEVVGWFQGRMEVGPRALGHRSIVALPWPAGNKDRVNAIKRREPWRPFAPSLLREEMAMLFGRDIDSPYMLLSLPLSEKGKREAPAISHVDGSARPQTVSPDNGLFRRLLQLVRKETGLGVILNTSFNGPGEPIVCTPADAIRSYMTLGLDALIIEDFVLAKSSTNT